MHYLYTITNQLNGKVYIGQTNNPDDRWYQHCYYAKENKHQQYIHRAMAKYGLENFLFEVIATCRTQKDANDVEIALITQYNSRNKESGYNLTPGGGGVGSGTNHPNFGKKQSQETINKRIEKLKGQKRTDEQKVRISEALKAIDKDQLYTLEVRQRMSEAHLGHKDSEETKKRKSENIKAQWATRIDYSRKCGAPDCDVSGKASYMIVNGVRYCVAHACRMKRNGILEKLPPFKYTNENPMPDEVRKKCGVANIGKVAHNRIIFTQDQVSKILSDSRSNKKIAKDFNVTEKVIKRIKDGKY